MALWPAVGCARPAGPGATAPSLSAPRAASVPRGGDATIRVGLATQVPGAVVTGARGASAANAAGLAVPPGAAVRVDPVERGIRVHGGALDATADTFTFEASPSNLLTVDGTSYRGRVEVRADGDAVTVVNHLSLEEYLRGVVPVEMGPRTRDELAALQAQAVASRTYAIANRGRFEVNGFDVQAGVTDQVYRGAGVETREGNRAVASTAGLVLLYDDTPITAFFHSTCGYATAWPDEVFRTVRPQPYLRSVSDRRGSGYYCDGSPRFRWEVGWSGEDLYRTLRRTVPASLGVTGEVVDAIRDVEVHRTGESGRAVEVRVSVGAGDIPVFGPDVRTVFAAPDGNPLGSTAIQLSVTHRADRVAGLVVSGAGWGHGVGMCQWGAIGRARAGQDFRTIVSTYFPGATLARWY